MGDIQYFWGFQRESVSGLGFKFKVGTRVGEQEKVTFKLFMSWTKSCRSLATQLSQLQMHDMHFVHIRVSTKRPLNCNFVLSNSCHLWGINLTVITQNQVDFPFIGEAKVTSDASCILSWCLFEVVQVLTLVTWGHDSLFDDGVIVRSNFISYKILYMHNFFIMIKEKEGFKHT